MRSKLNSLSGKHGGIPAGKRRPPTSLERFVRALNTIAKQSIAVRILDMFAVSSVSGFLNCPATSHEGRSQMCHALTVLGVSEKVRDQDMTHKVLLGGNPDSSSVKLLP